MLAACFNSQASTVSKKPMTIPTELYTSFALENDPAEQENLTKEINQLQEIDRQIDSGNYTIAAQALSELPANENTVILQTKLFLLAGQPRMALNRLNNLDKNSPHTNPYRYHYILELTSETLYRNNNVLGSAIADIENKKNPLTIWQKLLSSTVHTEKKEANATLKNEAIAWINLAELTKHHPNDFTQLKLALLNWQQQYPEHTANQLLSDINVHEIPTPKFIAVLLPLSGLHAESGASVQKGLLDAYYERHEPTSQTIVFYDTNSAPIDELYQKIKTRGHDLILGPLTKEDTERLLNIADNTPSIISLNYTNHNISPSHLQFGLSPEDEARQIADFAWREGKSAAIISPKSDKAKKITLAFSQAWAALGGIIIDRYNYQDTDKFATTIAKLLGITDSQSRQHKLHQTLLLHINSTLYSRKDADMIFLVSEPTIARQIVPFIKFYAGNSLPVFATSQVHNGYDAISQNKDLNDLYFCDMTVEFQTEEKNKNKLYFLGKDAYLLATQQTHLSALPHFPLTGNTGQLYLNPMMHTIQRELTCGQFKNGRATAFNTT